MTVTTSAATGGGIKCGGEKKKKMGKEKNSADGSHRTAGMTVPAASQLPSPADSNKYTETD
jgi:hypothetical protein